MFLCHNRTLNFICFFWIVRIGFSIVSTNSLNYLIIDHDLVLILRVCTTGLPSDVTIEVGEISFLLHKVLLYLTLKLIAHFFLEIPLK